ncbi:ABC transporter substrate-binding protein [Conexibacter woesei]|uniref:Extracellular solute-binding protein family 5 n=1 Tax=Conexibacter woesei (strain DSM 14684 / CCUG 47730 / CIP 108061 / JCM 11494 / NBRC 100937 / ID131577) TaxID=469383 RepID=D3F6Y5_CONWI|nr:ABC transporter substrate-binding protein [Conexibacter woesei]ADB52783.1 extracellular solute-binding protein family 5 [Conexibacter woesei DSM 14684]
MRSTTRAVVLAGALGVLALSGCGSGGNDSPTGTQPADGSVPATKPVRDGGTLRVGLTAEPDYIDPARMQSLDSWQVLTAMCEGLYKIGARGQAVPQLAVGAPRVSKDGLTATIKLRDGVQFNDGTPFDARAVKLSLERNGRTSVLFQGNGIERIDAPADDTVVLHLARPYAPLEGDLAGPGGMIGSPKQIAALGDKFGDRPVCVGPFEWVSRRGGDSIRLRRSDVYYDKENVHLDGLDFKVIPDTNARGVSLRAGEIDIAAEPPEPGALKSDSNLDVTTITGAGWKGLYVNVGNVDGAGKPPKPRDTPLSTSAEARQALSLAIDRQALINLTSGDGSAPACSAIPPSSPFYDDPPCPQKADPDAARALLERAGVRTPVKGTMVVAGSPEETRTAQAVQGMARDAGFDFEIETCDVATCIRRLLAGDFDVTLGGFDGVVDPDQSLSPFVASTGGFNFVGESDAELDRLLASARAESTDVDARRKLYRQALDRIRERAALIVFYNTGSSAAARKNVSGYVLTPSVLLDYKQAGFTTGP